MRKLIKKFNNFVFWSHVFIIQSSSSADLTFNMVNIAYVTSNLVSLTIARGLVLVVIFRITLYSSSYTASLKCCYTNKKKLKNATIVEAIVSNMNIVSPLLSPMVKAGPG